jgi:hypothetical protein
VFSKLKAEWQALRRGRPGHRFQTRYTAAHRMVGRGTLVSRIVRMVIAVACIVVGIVLMFIPGPAILFFVIAGSLLASESKFVARFLDWSELRIRSVLKWAADFWKRCSAPAKATLVCAALALAGGAAYVTIRIFFR